MGDAFVETNPNYSGDYREFSHNCQRCVVAYELRRRGYNVTALPTYEGDTKNQVAYRDNAKGTFEGRWKGAFRKAKTVNVGATTERKVMSNIDKQMSKAGEGSRGVIQIFYKGGGGHVFNVERKNGKTVYMEAQTGKVKNMAKTLTMVKTQSVNFVRTDNLRISARARDFVKQTRKK